jgi:sulfhydrogenase subunit delta
VTGSLPKVAVWKFASCDGCQLTLLDCEDELLAVAGAVEFAHFLEAGSTSVPGPYDLSIVEGSVTTAEEVERIREIRSQSKALISIGACATAGGVQALRNFVNVKDYIPMVYAHPEYIKTLATSTPISQHVSVDFELRGCPINKSQLLHVVSSFLLGKLPRLQSGSVCVECKRRGTTCITVAHGTPCLGPVTHAGCGAICPALDRGCFGCYGPADTVNTTSFVKHLRSMPVTDAAITRVFHTFNSGAPGFREVGMPAEEVSL